MWSRKDFKHELSFYLLSPLQCSLLQWSLLWWSPLWWSHLWWSPLWWSPLRCLFCGGLFCSDLLCSAIFCGSLFCGGLHCNDLLYSVLLCGGLLWSSRQWCRLQCRGNLRKSPDLQLRYYHRQALNNDEKLSCRPPRGSRAKIQKIETTQRRLAQKNQHKVGHSRAEWSTVEKIPLQTRNTQKIPPQRRPLQKIHRRGNHYRRDHRRRDHCRGDHHRKDHRRREHCRGDNWRTTVEETATKEKTAEETRNKNLSRVWNLIEALSKNFRTNLLHLFTICTILILNANVKYAVNIWLI